MRGRLSALLLTAILALAPACGSDGEKAAKGKEPTPTESVAGTTASETVAPEQSIDEKKPRKEEVAWVGRVTQWMYEMGGAVEVSAGVAMQLVDGKKLGPAERAAMRKAFGTLEGCTRAYERLVGKAPSVRLEDVDESLRDACDAYEEGIGFARTAVAKEDGVAFDDWEASWTNALKIVVTASDVFGDYQPANLRKLPVRKGAVSMSRIEPVFSNVSQRITPDGGAFFGSNEVRCWSGPDWNRLLRQMSVWSNERVTKDTQGFVGYAGDHRINLSPSVCNALVALRYKGERPTGNLKQLLISFAVSALAHEGEHARGVANEAAAQCYGMQRISQGARMLGANAAYANTLAELFWEEIYPLSPPGYMSPQCRQGGGLDAYQKRGTWP